MTLAPATGVGGGCTVKPGPKPEPLHPVTVSQAGLLFIERNEGCELEPYNDGAGNATIGVGHLIHLGPVTAADAAHYRGFTRTQALQLLEHDAAYAVHAVQQLVKVHLTQPQFDALVDFVFNVGAGAFASSTLLRLLNTGGYGSVPGQLALWTHDSNGRVEPGLVTRRRADGELFTHGTY